MVTRSLLKQEIDRVREEHLTALYNIGTPKMLNNDYKEMLQSLSGYNETPTRH